MNLYEKKNLWPFCLENFGKEKQHNTYMIILHAIKNRNSISPVFIVENKDIFKISDWFRKA